MLQIYNNKRLKQLKKTGIFNVFIGTPFSFTKKVHDIVLVLARHDDPGNELIVSSLPTSSCVWLCHLRLKGYVMLMVPSYRCGPSLSMIGINRRWSVE
jgi:hypothetical protein